MDKKEEETKEKKRIRDAKYYSKNRNNEEYMNRKRIRDSEYKKNQMKLKDKVSNTPDLTMQRLPKWEMLLAQYNVAIKCSPSYICASCGGLWYLESMHSTDYNNVRTLVGKEIAAVVISDGKLYYCSTCFRSIQQGKIPRLCSVNGLHFPTLPKELEGLTVLEERLVALRLPFMNIRSLSTDRQYGISGGIVNVPNNLDVVARVLPRSFQETSTIQVKLNRRMEYKNSYLYQTVRPYKVYRAAKFLVNTDLYKKENVILSKEWSKSEKNELLPYVVDPLDLKIDTIAHPLDTNEIEKDNSEMHMKQDQFNPNTSTLEDQEDDLPLTETMMQDEDFAIKIAPGENERPLSLLRDLDAEELSFPTIYAGQKRTIKDKSITYTDITRSEIRRYDRRCCRPDKLFFMFRKVQTQRLASNISLCLRKKRKIGNVTAENLLSSQHVENLIQQDDGYRILKNIVNSPAYLQDKKKDIMAMIRQLGIPTLFISLSSAETKWGSLLTSLYKAKFGKNISEEEALGLKFDQKADLIRADPVLCAMNFHHRRQALHRFLMKTNQGVFNPYGIEDSFERMEVQQRGSLHEHELVWIKDAPVWNPVDCDSETRCIEFIDKFITCSRDSSIEMMDLIVYQIHRHSHTCRKGQSANCRFNFPIPPMRKTRILHPLESDIEPSKVKDLQNKFDEIKLYLTNLGRQYAEYQSFDVFLSVLNLTEDIYIRAVRSSLKRSKIFLKRESNESFVNAYNKKLLRSWRANIDVQFVLDPYHCAAYCVNYISKSDRGVSKLLREADRDIKNGNFALKERLRHFANTFARGSEVSAQEAACSLMKLPMTICSRDVIFINTSPPTERVIMVKNTSDLENLDPKSEDIGEQSLLDHYVHRPETLNETTLAEFAAWFRYVKTSGSKRKKELVTPNSAQILLHNKGYIMKRTKAKVIRYRRYGKEQDLSNYYREQLMLYIPWRDELKELLLINSEIVYKRNLDKIQTNRKLYDPFQKEDQIEKIFLEAYLISTDDEDDQSCQDYSFMHLEKFKPDIQLDIGKTPTMFEHIRPINQIEDIEYTNMMKKLNTRQRRFLLHTIHRLKLKHTPSLELIHGQAGVGKSRLIESIVQTVVRYCNKEVGVNVSEIPIIVVAPTGKAAFNVSGITLHCAFRLPPNQHNGNLGNLNPSTCNTLRTVYNNLKIVLIDEISMTSLKHLQQIDARLRQIFNNDIPFSGIHTIVFGDFYQLRPVFGQFVFENPKGPLGSIIGNSLWEPSVMFELTEIMRQRDDAVFAEALNRLSMGKMTKEDVLLFQGREAQDEENTPSDIVQLFSTNAACSKFNDYYLESLSTPAYHSWAQDSIEGNGSAEQKSKMLKFATTFSTADADGMPTHVCLKVGSRYMVTTNIDVSDGLFNGATGVLRKVEIGTLNSGEKAVRMVFIEFENQNIGRRARLEDTNSRNDLKHLTPIKRETRTLQKTGYHQGLQIVRRQIPLAPANGITIHKAQGSSLKQVVVNIPARGLSRTQLYVACSRATSLQGLFIHGKFRGPPAVLDDHPVQKELHRLREKPFAWSLKSWQDVSKDFWKLTFHNVQSFSKHRDDIVTDPSYTQADFIFLTETWSLRSDSIDFENFITLTRNDCDSQRDSRGSIILMNCLSQIDNRSPGTSFKIVTAQNGSHIQFTIVTLEKTSVVMTYRHPKFPVSNMYEEIRKIFPILSKTFIIWVGDFNINLLSDDASKLKSVFKEFGLQVCQKSESTTDGNSMLDAMFTNIIKAEAWTGESYFSYHKPLCVIWPKSNLQTSDFDQTPQKLLKSADPKPFEVMVNEKTTVLDEKLCVVEFSPIQKNHVFDIVTDFDYGAQRRGIFNLGNTCFVNSILQMLSESGLFRTFLDNPISNAQRVLKAFICATRKNVELRSLMHLKKEFDICFPNFAGGYQQDAFEFCLAVLNTLDEQTPVRNHFLISGTTNLVCSCGFTSWQKYEEVGMSLANVTDIQNTIDKELRGNFIVDYRCERCNDLGKTFAVLKIDQAPTHFLMHVKRFGNDGTKLHYPLNPAAEITLRTRDNFTAYGLIGLVSHIGCNLNMGHYVAAVPVELEKWLVLDDSNVVTSYSVPTDVYILLYEKRK